MIFYKVRAFIKRDFQVEASYPLNFAMMTVTSFLPLILFFFISKMIDPKDTNLQKYGGDYFSFVIVGLAFVQYYRTALNSYTKIVQRDQMTGCLESMLCSQTSPQVVIMMSALYSMFFATIQLVIVFIGGFIFFGFNLSQINFIASAVISVLSLFLFLGFGLISTAGIVVLKKGDPLGFLLMNTNIIVGGAFFPVEVMPSWLQKFAIIVPAKYSLDALRLTIIRGYDLTLVSEQAMILGLMVLIIIPFSIKMLLMAVKKAKKDGTLVHY